MRRAELSRVMRVTLRDIPLFALFCLRFRRDSFISPESEGWEEGCGGWWSFDCSLWLWCHLFFLIGSIVCSSVFWVFGLSSIALSCIYGVLWYFVGAGS